jgi:hypothetical protein
MKIMNHLNSLKSLKGTLAVLILIMALSPICSYGQLSNSYIQNQTGAYQNANFWINGYARVGGAEGAYDDYLTSVYYISNAYSGLVLQSNGSINYGITGSFAPNFQFRWLAHNNGSIDYSKDNDILMTLQNSGILTVKTGIKVGTNPNYSTVWTSGNDGAGSGLDADLIRGEVPQWTTSGSIIYNTNSGNILTGKTTQTDSSYKLDVNGNIRADKLVVNTTGADYVLDPGYHLPSLDSLNNYIKTNHHLPGIKPASQMQQQGIDVGESQKELL